MNRKHLVRGFVGCLSLVTWICMSSPGQAAQEPIRFIGTGNVTGVYYAAGSAVAKMFNKHRAEYGLRLQARATEGSIANISDIMDGEIAFGIAQANARVDLTAAGSEVINEILLFIDPEQKEPTYNLVRDLTRRVQGLGRPEINIVLDKGFYDVNIGFPTLGVAKEVRRIPLGQTLALKYSKDLLDEYLPDAELLLLTSAIGIDAEGNWVYLEE